MKKLLGISMFLLLVSCTKNISKEITPMDAQQPFIAMASSLSSSIVFDQDREEAQDDAQIINLGKVKENQYNSQRIYLKNNYNSSLTIKLDDLNAAFSSSTAFKLVNNNCGQYLLNGEVCFIDIKLVHDINLSYAPVNIELTTIQENSSFGKIVLIGEKEDTVVNKNYQFVNVGQELNFNNISKTIRIYVKNQGDKIANPQITIPSEYSVSKTDCTGIISKNKACFIDLKINGAIDSNVVGINKKIEFDGTSFAIKAGELSPEDSISCKLNYSNINNVCVQTSQVRSCNPQPLNSSGGHQESTDAGLSWGACLNSQCLVNYSDIGGVCVATNQTRSCNPQPSHSLGGTELSSNGGQSWSTCSGFTCNSLYTNVNNICKETNQSRLCLTQPEHSNGGTESTSNGGVSWGSCTGYSCLPTFTNVGGICKSTNQTESCAIANGSGSRSSTDGGVSFGQCTIVNCNSSYTQVGNLCKETNQSRACAAQPSNSTGGTQSSIDGGQTWGTCANYSCVSTHTNIAGTCTLTNQTESCTISHGQGQRTSTNAGVSWSQCNVLSCETNYSNVSNQCQYGIVATGGTITYTNSSGLLPRSTTPYAGGYTVHTFSNAGTFKIISGVSNIEYLVIGGGGGGGGTSGGNGTFNGGGGAGGFLTGIQNATSAGDYLVKVGLGGNGGLGAANANPSNGGSSSYEGPVIVIALGGGYGGNPGAVGGSGGGGLVGGSGTSLQGKAGGSGTSSATWGNGGGGGAGTAGGSGTTSTAGFGGNGLSSSISGVATTYAGGGGGTIYITASQTAGLGGTGGGGNGRTGNGNGFPGVDGLGGGGGAGGSIGGQGSTQYTGGKGGNGIVIIRYRNE